VAIGSVERIQRDLSSALLRLRGQRMAGRQALAAAPIAEDQAKVAGLLETSFRGAAKAVAAIPTPTGTTDLALAAAALDRTADAYRALTDAISGGDTVGFDVARREILEAEARVRMEIAAAVIP
jgi:hypothetical protein